MNQTPQINQHIYSGNGPVKARLDKLAWVLDSVIPLPFGFRFGLDSLVGLIPGVGDGATAVMSTYILAEGAKAGAPKSVLGRMIGNVLIDTVLGTIPFIGDLFDMRFRSNQRNVSLLQDYLDQPHSTESSSRWFFIVALLLLLAIIATGVWLSLKLVGLLLASF